MKINHFNFSFSGTILKKLIVLRIEEKIKGQIKDWYYFFSVKYQPYHEEDLHIAEYVSLFLVKFILLGKLETNLEIFSTFYEEKEDCWCVCFQLFSNEDPNLLLKPTPIKT